MYRPDLGLPLLWSVFERTQLFEGGSSSKGRSAAADSGLAGEVRKVPLLCSVAFRPEVRSWVNAYGPRGLTLGPGGMRKPVETPETRCSALCRRAYAGPASAASPAPAEPGRGAGTSFRARRGPARRATFHDVGVPGERNAQATPLLRRDWRACRVVRIGRTPGAACILGAGRGWGV